MGKNSVYSRGFIILIQIYFSLEILKTKQNKLKQKIPKTGETRHQTENKNEATVTKTALARKAYLRNESN